MAELNPDKIVEFHKYCELCVHFNKKETDDPCFDCLDNPVNEYSRRPVHFKEKVSKNKIRGKIRSYSDR